MLLIGLGRRSQSKTFELVWETELDLNTCNSKKFDIDNNTILITVISVNDYKKSFFNGLSKIEIHLNDEMKSSYVAEDLDATKNIATFQVTALTSKKWQELITTNIECSKEGHNKFHNEDRRSDKDIDSLYKCFTWKLLSIGLDSKVLTNDCEESFMNDPVILQEVGRELVD